MDWGNKTYLITGGTSGIGLQVATDLAVKGAKVVIVGSNPTKLEHAASRLPAGNHGICFDLRNLNKIGDIFAQCAEWGIVFDGMVHCAGISPLMLVRDNDVQTMLDAFAVNYFSFVELVKYFQREMTSASAASIVAISSITASQASNRQSVYGSSKAALEETVRCLAKELMLRHIRVNAVAPGVVEGEMLAQLETKSNGIARSPLGTIPAEQVSRLILYLLSDDAAYMTGSILKMDAGHDVWLR